MGLLDKFKRKDGDDDKGRQTSITDRFSMHGGGGVGRKEYPYAGSGAGKSEHFVPPSQRFPLARPDQVNDGGVKETVKEKLQRRFGGVGRKEEAGEKFRKYPLARPDQVRGSLPGHSSQYSHVGGRSEDTGGGFRFHRVNASEEDIKRARERNSKSFPVVAGKERFGGYGTNLRPNKAKIGFQKFKKGVKVANRTTHFSQGVKGFGKRVKAAQVARAQARARAEAAKPQYIRDLQQLEGTLKHYHVAKSTVKTPYGTLHIKSNRNPSRGGSRGGSRRSGPRGFADTIATNLESNFDIFGGGYGYGSGGGKRRKRSRSSGYDSYYNQYDPLGGYGMNSGVPVYDFGSYLDNNLGGYDYNGGGYGGGYGGGNPFEFDTQGYLEAWDPTAPRKRRRSSRGGFY